MSETINPKSINPLFYRQEGYKQGLLSGYTKSITLVRHLQRTLSPHTDTGSQRKILEEAMELISKEIKVNNE